MDNPTLEDCLRKQVPPESIVRAQVTIRGEAVYVTFLLGKVGEVYLAKLDGNILTMITPTELSAIDAAIDAAEATATDAAPTV